MIVIAPIDYAKDLALAEFLFQRGAMTIKELIDNFGNKLGLTVEDPDDYYLNSRYLNNVPLDLVWSNVADNEYLDADTILASFSDMGGDDIDPVPDADEEEDKADAVIE